MGPSWGTEGMSSQNLKPGATPGGGGLREDRLSYLGEQDCLASTYHLDGMCLVVGGHGVCRLKMPGQVHFLVPECRSAGVPLGSSPGMEQILSDLGTLKFSLGGEGSGTTTRESQQPGILRNWSVRTHQRLPQRDWLGKELKPTFCVFPNSPVPQPAFPG